MRKKKSTRQLVGIESITGSSVQTADGELSFYFVQPTNLNVLPEAGVRGRVMALLGVLALVIGGIYTVLLGRDIVSIRR